MGKVRPLLVIRACPGGALATTGVRPAQRLRNLPRRLVIRVERFSKDAPWLALALMRPAHPDRPRPLTVALEFDPDLPLHRILLAPFFLYCDATPAARATLRRLVSSAPMDTTGLPEHLGALMRSDERARIYRRCDALLRRRPGRRLALLALVQILTNAPTSASERACCKRIVETAMQVLARGDAKLVSAALQIYDTLNSRQSPPSAILENGVRHLGREESRFALMAVAVVHGRSIFSLPGGRSKRFKSLRNAAASARSAKVTPVSTQTRILRRCMAWIEDSTDGERTLARAYRAAALAGRSASLRNVTSGLLVDKHYNARLHSVLGRQVGLLLASTERDRSLDINVARELFGHADYRFSALIAPEKRRHHRQLDRARRNRLLALAARVNELQSRMRDSLHHLSLGLCPAGWNPRGRGATRPDTPGFLPKAWAQRGSGMAFLPTRKSVRGALDTTCLGILQGRAMPPETARLLRNGLKTETIWSRQLIISMVASSFFLGRSDARTAARCCARGRKAYRSFLKLRRQLEVEYMPQPLLDYEQSCCTVLAAFEPPIPPGPDPVRTLARVVQSLPRRSRVRPKAAIDALDALITAGHSAAHPAVEERVVKQLARMLRARVLFHRTGGRYIQREDQRIHTLSSWTLLELAREPHVRARRIRPRPEFWWPKQRRPGGVLTLPLGTGVACLARPAAFTRKEVRAVRTVLRFLEAHRAPPAATENAPTANKPRALPPPASAKGLVGTSRPWRRVLKQVWKVAPTRCSVLLRGESGTGKELLARAFHLASKRAQGPFVAVNCAAINADTMLSELFGHIRGAFTGALRSRDGLVRRAHGGTLFLDEVGDMPLEMQVALLRVLQERVLRPVGSTREHPVDVRVLSATNRDLEALVRDGKFREDLVHRINVVEIRVPALRERLSDLPLLCNHILERLDEPKSLHMDALPLLSRYGWPGNVRELDNVLRASALLSDGPEVNPEVIAQVLRGRRHSAPPTKDRLPPRAAQIMERLADAWLSAPGLATRLGVSTRTVNRELTGLIDCGLVVSDGQARARRYRAR